MKRVPLFASVAAAAPLLLAALVYGASAPQTKTHQFRCTDRNTSLYFVVYERGGNLDGGNMYVENMQVGVLAPENAGTNVIKATSRRAASWSPTTAPGRAASRSARPATSTNN